ncbi:MAG: DUF805 domain-containing protein [Abditibacteriota bacterium]|nr:DUF805 domain-containing protein [Abditibacteriota bacterium]
MTFFDEYLSADYLRLEGRAGRSEFWRFVLICIILNLATLIIDFVIGSNIRLSNNTVILHVGINTIVIGLFLLVGQVSAAVRRLHDTGRSGKWALAAVVPGFLTAMGILLEIYRPFLRQPLLPVFMLLFAAGLALLIALLALPGTKGKNEYGPAPRD